MRHERLFLPFALAACAAALQTGCSGDRRPEKTEAKAALTVELVSPFSSRWPDVLQINGNVAAWQESVVGAEQDGLKLAEVLVDVGDLVATGQVLARFDPEISREELALAEAQVAQLEAQSALSSDKAARARRLEGSGTVSTEDLLRYDTDEKTSAAQLASAKAQLRLRRLLLLRTEVLAPDDGVVSSRSAAVGAVAGAGTELFRLIRRGRLEWRASVPADQLPRVSRGQRAILRNVDLVENGGLVRQVAPTVDPANLNGLVYVDLPANTQLRAGMFVSGELLLGESAALHVPESSLVFRDGFRYVMKIDRTNRVRQTKVATGRRLDGEVEIVEGELSSADRIVYAGGVFLNEGDLVRVAGTRSSAAKGGRP